MTSPIKPRPRVLVVDDEPVIHELAREVLRDVDVLSAECVADARAIVAAHPELEVALVDKNLPDGSGLDLVRWLRANAPECEAIMITGYPSMDSVLEALSLGAADYLLKPMRDINELRVRVGHACARVQSRRTEQRLAAELRASEARYRGLFEASADAVIVIDDDTRTIVDANAAAEAMYGRTRGELAGMPAAALHDATVPPETRAGVIVRRDRRADDTTFPVEVTCGLTSADRRLAIEIVRDVSERERAAAERAELEGRLARAAKLEAVGRLAAGVAHDFNNVLCVVLNACEFVEDAVADGNAAAAREEIEQIKEAVASGASLTRQLLVFGRRTVSKPQIVDLNARITAVATMLERTVGANVKLELDLAPNPTTVLIDPGQLEQVIANLVVNARDALATRGGHVSIATRPQNADADACGVAIVVTDDGPGIPDDVLPHVFEPFFTTKGERGTGLGLANVHEIVRRANGAIDVVSQLGRGTTFTIWLPVVDGTPERSRKIAIGARGGGETVLVVEDDERVREVTRRILEAGGYVVRAVRDAETALAFVAGGGKIDAVVADIELPGMDGIECVRRLVEHDPRLEAVFTSAVVGDGPPRAKFLPKPYAPPDLLGCVRNVLDGRAA
ncbi:MAG TPA: response regulator [Kofleriaceae bacterium]|jgi:PAS domain S-box-containing protein